MSVSSELLCSFELLKPLDSSALKSHIKKGRNKRQQMLNSPVSRPYPASQHPVRQANKRSSRPACNRKVSSQAGERLGDGVHEMPRDSPVVTWIAQNVRKSFFFGTIRSEHTTTSTTTMSSSVRPKVRQSVPQDEWQERKDESVRSF